ncbi:MAG TPA: TonB-dependent receptor, partial [Colwellia sp.]|nr:TonB-dependent receptor [Colwellia sp.]
YYREKAVHTTELRAISNQGQEIFNGTTSWVAGIFFKQDDEDLLRQYTYADGDFTSTNESKSIAVYGQLETQLAEQWSLISGLRIENRSADYNNSNLFNDSIDDIMVGGKLVLSYQQTQDNLWYASINRGYKAGGNNTDGTLPADLRTFEPEYLMNYELGYKVSLLNNNAYIRSSVFYMDRTDMQVKSSKTIVRKNGSAEFVSYLGNATSGSNYGVEIESAWQLNDTVNIYGSLGLLNTEFDQFIDADGNSLTGKEQAHAPNYQFNVGINYQPTDEWLFNISVDGKDEFYFSDTRYYEYEEGIYSPIPEDDIKSEVVVLLNASISYLQDNWQLKVWARNLANKDYANRGFYFGNDPRDGYTPKQYTQLSEPLVFGASLDYQF